MKKWNVDRVPIFLFIAVVSFLYDLTFYLGIRDTTRFPHPFVYFRSLGDIEYLRGFPGMLRQAMFSLIAGGLIGLAASLILLKNGSLARETIRFLRIAMWFPFFVVFAIPETRLLGICVALLAAVYHYSTARLFLEFSSYDALSRATGEVAFQVLFFTLLTQVWVRRWEWTIFPLSSDAAAGFAVLAIISGLVLLLNWIFRKSFQTGCALRAIMRGKEFLASKQRSFVGVTLLAMAWLLIWELTCAVVGFDEGRPFLAIQRIPEFLTNGGAWRDIRISLVEIASGLVFGGVVAFLASLLLPKSRNIPTISDTILPATYLSPIAAWLLAFFAVQPSSDGLYIDVGHKVVAVGFLTFFPLLQALWAFRDAALLQRWASAVDEALPIAFVAMLFAELYAATAGLGFWMTVASATEQYQQGLAGFLITAILLTAFSTILRLIPRSTRFGVSEPPASRNTAL